MTPFLFFTLPFLLFLSLKDLKSRTVCILPSLVFTGGMLLTHLFTHDLSRAELGGGILLGAGLFVISRLTRQAIGYGDALVILACACALGFSAELSALLISLLLCAFLSLILLLLKKVTRKDTLPFLPFLFTGHLLLLLAQILPGFMYSSE